MSTLKSNTAIQGAAMQQRRPLSTTHLQYILLHCNITGNSYFQLCRTSCCFATPLATIHSNPAVQAAEKATPLATLKFNTTVQVAALQQHWSVSTPNLQYKLLVSNTTGHSPNFAVQAAASQHHWPLSSPNLQYKLLRCNTIGHSQV